MEITELEDLEIRYNAIFGKLADLYKKRNAIKEGVVDIVELLNYNDLLIEIQYLIVRSQYLARELYMNWTNIYIVEYSKAMIECEAEKRQSTYAKEQAKLNSQEYLTKANIWEVRWKRLRDEYEVVNNDIYNKKTRIRYLTMEDLDK